MVIIGTECSHLLQKQDSEVPKFFYGNFPFTLQIFHSFIEDIIQTLFVMLLFETNGNLKITRS